MKSIIYIRLDSSPLPIVTPNLIIKDVNTENYFCSFLGKQIMYKANCTNLTVFPGKLLIDYASVDNSAYDEVMQKYRDILLALLSDTSKKANNFSLQLPYEFIDWLCCHENDDYREIGNHITSTRISFTSIDLYDAIVDKVILPQLRFFFRKQSEQIDFISFSLPLPQDNLLSKSLAINNIRIADIREFKLNTEYESFCACNGMIKIMNKETKKYGFINENSEEVFPCIYDFATDFNTDTAFAYDGKECYKLFRNGNRDFLCSIEVDLYFWENHHFSDGLLRIRNSENQYSFYDTNGKIVLTVEYEGGIGDFHEGLARVHNGGEDAPYGYIDKNGEEVIPCQFDYAEDFHEGLAVVELYERQGYINKNGEIVIACKFDTAGDFKEGKAEVSIDEENGIIKKDGQYTPFPNSSRRLSDSLFLIEDDDSKCHVIDIEGNLVYKYNTPYSYWGRYSDGLILVSHFSYYLYLDEHGKAQTSKFKPYILMDIGREINNFEFSNKRALIDKGDLSKGHKFGYIDTTGKEIIRCQYHQAYKFSDNLARVIIKQKGIYKTAFIDVDGQIVIPPIFDDACDFHEGVAWVRMGKRIGVLLKEWFIK